MDRNLAAVVRSITLFAAEAAFLGLVTAFVVRTFEADPGVVPDLSSVQVSAAGALAVVLGVGYAIALGVQPAGATEDVTRQGIRAAIKTVFAERFWLSIGVFAYMLAGFAASFAYALNENETPSILKTIAVGFGGYVIAYIGTAYRQLAT
jgi:hypothetical protein